MAPAPAAQYMASRDLVFQLASLSLPVNATPGVYVLQDPHHPLILQGIIFAPHDGPYAGGVFRFLVRISDGRTTAAAAAAASSSWSSSGVAPEASSNHQQQHREAVPPVVEFKRGLPSHPLIHTDHHTLTLAPAFARWQPRKHTLVHLLRYIRRIFEASFLDDEVAAHEGWWTNAEMGRLLRTSPNLFRKLASQSVALSTSRSVLHDLDEGEDDDDKDKDPHQGKGKNKDKDKVVVAAATSHRGSSFADVKKGRVRPSFPLPELSDVERVRMDAMRREILGTTDGDASSDGLDDGDDDDYDDDDDDLTARSLDRR
ncbi:unnamed protein product [Parajaminaea phylloscopi]